MRLGRGIYFTGMHWNIRTFAIRSHNSSSSLDLLHSLSSLLEKTPMWEHLWPSLPCLAAILFLEYFCLKIIQNIINCQVCLSPSSCQRKSKQSPLSGTHQTPLSVSILPLPSPQTVGFSLHMGRFLVFSKLYLPSTVFVFTSSPLRILKGSEYWKLKPKKLPFFLST